MILKIRPGLCLKESKLFWMAPEVTERDCITGSSINVAFYTGDYSVVSALKMELCTNNEH